MGYAKNGLYTANVGGSSPSAPTTPPMGTQDAPLVARPARDPYNIWLHCERIETSATEQLGDPVQ